MVFVNTVVIGQGKLGLTPGCVAVTLASFGAGSTLAALTLSPLLATLPERTVMLSGVAVMLTGVGVGTVTGGFVALVALWFVIGIGYSTAQTPSGRLLRQLALKSSAGVPSSASLH